MTDISENLSVTEADVSGARSSIAHALNVNLFMNAIVIKSNLPGVAPVLRIIQSHGAPLTDEQRAEIIAEERRKMREAAAAAAAVAITDVSGAAATATVAATTETA